MTRKEHIQIWKQYLFYQMTWSCGHQGCPLCSAITGITYRERNSCTKATSWFKPHKYAVVRNQKGMINAIFFKSMIQREKHTFSHPQNFNEGNWRFITIITEVTTISIITTHLSTIINILLAKYLFTEFSVVQCLQIVYINQHMHIYKYVQSHIINLHQHVSVTSVTISRKSFLQKYN